MSKYRDMVKAASSPQAALTLLATGIDDILKALERLEHPPMIVDAWSQWQDVPLDIQPLATADYPPKAVEVHDDGDHIEVNLAAVDEAKGNARRIFAEHILDLQNTLGGDEDWVGAYAKGGPLWLYYANREIVMGFSEAARQEMVRDVEEYDPEEAQLMSRDILKFPSETGPGGTGMMIADG